MPLGTPVETYAVPGVFTVIIVLAASIIAFFFEILSGNFFL